MAKKDTVKRLSIYTPDEFLNSLDQYMKANGIRSRGTAVKELAQQAMETWELATFFSERIECDIEPAPREHWTIRFHRWVKHLEKRTRETVMALCV